MQTQCLLFSRLPLNFQVLVESPRKYSPLGYQLGIWLKPFLPPRETPPKLLYQEVLVGRQCSARAFAVHVADLHSHP